MITRSKKAEQEAINKALSEPGGNMENIVINNSKAGFWVRFAATWVDLFIVWAMVKLVVAIFYQTGLYVPFELTFVLSFLIYSVLLVGWRGSTIGKLSCGLTVQSKNNNSCGYLRALLREVAGKLVSCFVLFLGFLWVGFRSSKRGWHDYIARTTVVQKTSLQKRARIILWTVLVLIAVSIGRKTLEIGPLVLDMHQMSLPSSIQMPYTNRDSSSLVEISSLNEGDYPKFIKWLDINAKDPVEYAVETAAKHQVTIFGEVHQQRDYLLFLNEIIPELYHRAGVTCVAMEVFLAEDNETINRLVTAKDFDHSLALEIARHQSWGIWGSKEYWDVLETVWRLNQEIPDGQKKMWLIGIDAKFDGPSLGLVTGGDGAKIKAPLWEKLRFLRLFDDILLLVKRDELMARNIEREIIEKEERAIVWVGLMHSYTHYQQPIIMNGRLVRKFNRMGLLLHQKYGDDIFQVALHESYFNSVMGKFVGPVMKERGDMPVGFDVLGSPFEDLRNNDSGDYHHYPNLRFADKARGYIYLNPVRELGKCGWFDGYVSRKMFLKNKPYYKAWARLGEREANNAEEANEALKWIFEH